MVVTSFFSNTHKHFKTFKYFHVILQSIDDDNSSISTQDIAAKKGFKFDTRLNNISYCFYFFSKKKDIQYIFFFIFNYELRFLK